jgi:hypothetical protein
VVCVTHNKPTLALAKVFVTTDPKSTLILGSYITRFRPWSPITTGNHLARAELKKFPKLLRQLALLTFFIRVQALWDPLHRELPNVEIFINYGPNPLT